MPEISDKLQQQRDLIEERLTALRQFYEQQSAQDLQGQIQARASGQAVPFTPDVLNSMYVDSANAAAGGFNRDREMISRAMSNAGLGGSGLMASALQGASRRAAAIARRGRRQAFTSAQLSNFQAQERAQQQAQSYLAQQAQQQMQAGQSELNYRQNLYETTQQQELDAQRQAAMAQYQGVNPFLKQLERYNSVGWGPNSGGPGRHGGQSRGQYTAAGQFFGWDKGRAEQALANKRTSLEAQAADWNNRRDQALLGYGTAT